VTRPGSTFFAPAHPVRQRLLRLTLPNFKRIRTIHFPIAIPTHANCLLRHKLSEFLVNFQRVCGSDELEGISRSGDSRQRFSHSSCPKLQANIYHPYARMQCNPPVRTNYYLLLRYEAPKCSSGLKFSVPTQPI
jgi:hypothetical protein